jgi:hypothetical protein
MSRTNKSSGGSSPVKKYLAFGGGTGEIQWYDKNAPEDERKKSVESLDFVLLDIKSSIKGYHEASSSQISSNMLDPYAVGKEDFEVKLGGKVVKTGIWSQIKAELDSIAKGAKFTTNIFALADVGDGVEVVKLDLNGSALSPWIEFSKSLGDTIDDKKITITKGQLCTRKNGETAPVSDAEYKKILDAAKKNPLAPRPVLFYESSFSAVDLTEAEAEAADAADEKLQAYFDSIGLGASSDEVQETVKEDPAQYKAPSPVKDEEAVEEDDLPF